MSQDLLNRSIYPSIYERADQIFPEFSFRRTAKGWQSTNRIKVDGSTGESIGKVHLYENNPAMLKDWTRESLSIWRYIAQRDNLTEKKDIFKALAEYAQVTLPAPPSLPRDRKRFLHPAVLNLAWSQMRETLRTATEAQPVREALIQDRRYSSAEIEAMGLGYLGDRVALRQHLLAHSVPEGFEAKHLDFFLDALPQGMGTTHRLILPYRDEKGHLQGFAARATAPDTPTKYLYSRHLERGKHLFTTAKGLPRGGDITLVEGLFDGLILAVRGLDGVAALGGTTLNEHQVAHLKTLRPPSLTLMLDNDQAGKTATRRLIGLLTKHAPEIPLYVLAVPDGHKDPDDWLRETPMATVRTAWTHAASAGTYWAEDIFTRYEETLSSQVPWPPRQRDAVLTECQKTLGYLWHAGEKSDFRSRILARFHAYGITEEMLLHCERPLTDDHGKETRRQMQHMLARLDALSHDLRSS